ncbi:PucR family transcriptional regulator [Gordonia phthalatica]|uniref:PucR family transcriptional regulator n=1 Tax=Gordonia phthalatica TaxID=1136941 RepID=A0A0N9NDP1_9ACTN|nr:helix-turn-helix domain-containing protein [Gordonia phthalatica]ALG83245.1 hypothetical protein ACH46_00370 [Gordonia phthalatica]
MTTRRTVAEVQKQAKARVSEVARTIGERVPELATAMHLEIAENIPALHGDPLMLELLRASTESNVETFVHLAQHGLALDDVEPPPAATAYAQRLAQRDISSIALISAYRLGQRSMVDLAFAEIPLEGTDPEVAYAAVRLMHELAFGYIDRVSEKVVVAYESERESWLANRSTVRATTLAGLLSGEEMDVGDAESALGYRLRQRHLGVVLWESARDNSTSALRRLESVVGSVAQAVGAVGQPLFIPKDRSLAWAWIPLGRGSTEVDHEAILRRVDEETSGSIRVALGSVGASTAGFRESHGQAVRAYSVATVARDRALTVTTYDDPGVRTVAMLVGDLPAARSMVVSTLGPLAADDEAAERLRETLSVFYRENGSYQAVARILHLHRNSVKYRVDRATEMRGRPIEDDRFNVELALLACQWLGRAVLIDAD